MDGSEEGRDEEMEEEEAAQEGAGTCDATEFLRAPIWPNLSKKSAAPQRSTPQAGRQSNQMVEMLWAINCE